MCCCKPPHSREPGLARRASLSSLLYTRPQVLPPPHALAPTPRASASARRRLRFEVTPACMRPHLLATAPCCEGGNPPDLIVGDCIFIERISIQGDKIRIVPQLELAEMGFLEGGKGGVTRVPAQSLRSRHLWGRGGGVGVGGGAGGSRD